MPKSNTTVWQFTIQILLGLSAVTIAAVALIIWSRDNHMLCAVSQPGYCSPVLTDDTGSAWLRLELSDETVNFAVNYSMPLAEGRVTHISVVSLLESLDLCGGSADSSCQDLEAAACLEYELTAPCGFLRGSVSNSFEGRLEKNSFAYQARLASEAHPTLAQCGVWQGRCTK